VQLERQDFQVASSGLPALFSDCFIRCPGLSWVFPDVCGSKHVLTMNTVLTLSFALLADDKAATAKNDRAQKNPPERVGKGDVFSVSSSGTH